MSMVAAKGRGPTGVELHAVRVAPPPGVETGPCLICGSVTCDHLARLVGRE